jgi:hypothetical protein
MALCASARAVGAIVTVNDGGASCWFQDEHVIVAGGKLIILSLTAGLNDSTFDPVNGNKLRLLHRRQGGTQHIRGVKGAR